MEVEIGILILLTAISATALIIVVLQLRTIDKKLDQVVDYLLIHDRMNGIFVRIGGHLEDLVQYGLMRDAIVKVRIEKDVDTGHQRADSPIT